MSSAVNGSSAPEHFERGSVIEIRNGMMLDFYPGRPHLRNIMWQPRVKI